MTKRYAAAAALLSLTLAACGGGAGSGGDGLTGQIQADGSSTVFPVTEAVAEEFQIAEPGVQVTVGVSGTGGGFEKFCSGETDISNASREIKESEAQACEASGVEYIELSVAIDGLAVVVSPENDWVTCLTTAELNAIWKPGSTVKKWNQVRPSFPDRPIKLYGPGTDSGTFDYFTETINGEDGASRTDFTASEDDNTLVTGVAGDAESLGYFGYAYYAENQSKLKVLEIDGGEGCVAPSDETVTAGTYAPLSRPLFVYVRVDSLQRPEVEAFVRFYLEVAQELVADVGYSAPSQEVIDADLAKVESALAG
jgi:phosphate transport system substrate-binding protein